MASEKKKFPSTPKGKARYAWLTKADTKFDADGVYKVNLVLDEDSINPIIEAIDAQAEAFLAEKRKAEKNPVKAKKLKLSPDKPYGETEDGEMYLKFKMKAKGKTKDGEEFTQKPKLFDAKGTPITGDLPLGKDSIIRVSYEPVSYHHPKDGIGVTLRLRAVQVLELVPYTSTADAGDYGFEAEEEGYSADDAENPTASAEDEPEESEEEEDEDEGDGDF